MGPRDAPRRSPALAPRWVRAAIGTTAPAAPAVRPARHRLPGPARPGPPALVRGGHPVAGHHGRARLREPSLRPLEGGTSPPPAGGGPRAAPAAGGERPGRPPGPADPGPEAPA